MKKITILFVSVLSLGLALTSCSKDDDSSSGGSAALEGSWEYTKTGVKAGGEEALFDYTNDCSTKKDYLKINTGGTMNDYWYDIDCVEEIDNGTWTRSGNTLAVSFGGVPVNATILELTSSTLKIEYTEEGVTNVEVFRRK